MTDGGTPYSAACANPPPPASPLARPGGHGVTRVNENHSHSHSHYHYHSHSLARWPGCMRARTRAGQPHPYRCTGQRTNVAPWRSQSVTARRAYRARDPRVIRCCFGGMGGRVASSMRQRLGELVQSTRTLSPACQTSRVLGVSKNIQKNNRINFTV